MHYRQSRGKGRGSVFELTSRLTVTAQNDDERRFLAWLAEGAKSGKLKAVYREEKAQEPGVLEGLTDEDLRDARRLYTAIISGGRADLSVERIAELEAKGFVRDLRRLPGRGRYAGRYEFAWCDRLAIVYRAMAHLGIAPASEGD